MKKILFVCLLIFILAVTIETDSSSITGLFLQIGSVIINIARYVLKEVLTFIANLL